MPACPRRTARSPGCGIANPAEFAGSLIKIGEAPRLKGCRERTHEVQNGNNRKRNLHDACVNPAPAPRIANPSLGLEARL